MKCPNCGSESSGAFCADCGTPLKGARCKHCKAALQPGANFCTSCGTATHESARAQTNPAWYVAGAALLVLIGVLIWPMVSGSGGNQAQNDGRMPMSQIATEGEPQGDAPPPLTGTPREQADRLFNRIMTEQAGGDTARAKFFLPMAFQAYDNAGELDNDALYHLTLLHSLGGDFPAARAAAERILAREPNHLLALSSAGNAARDAGDSAAARQYYSKFLSAYDAESKRDLPEYRDHGRVFPDLKAEAEAFVK
jgi:hypothetical protein